MANLPTPKRLAEVANISGPYASMILSGKRTASSEIALAAFRAFGVRLGLLAQMSDDDIAKLCEQVRVSSCDHPTTSTPTPALAQSGKADDLTAQQGVAA